MTSLVTIDMSERENVVQQRGVFANDKDFEFLSIVCQINKFSFFCFFFLFFYIIIRMEQLRKQNAQAKSLSRILEAENTLLYSEKRKQRNDEGQGTSYEI